MRYILMPSAFLLLFTISTLQAQDQKVGLVLSGGGAKGLAHVGVIRALVENDIPIDYITGTSMGGVVGAFYAAGYSIDQIENIVGSNTLEEWINGQVADEYTYFFNNKEDTPSWLSVDLGVDSTFEASFNPKLANDLSLNFGLMEYLAPAGEASNYNFDSLYVPFVAMGAEVFTQQAVVLNRGSLGRAVRATMSVPFVYRPIKVDGKYLFDGGIYDNFPANVMKEKYQPDVLIGVNVASKRFSDYPHDKDAELISNSLLFMIMDKADPNVVGEDGIYIEPNVGPFSGFDFAKAEAIVDSGYVAAMRLMPEIKRQVSARISCDERAEKRNAFLVKQKPLLFDKILLRGYSKNQQHYIRKSLRKGSDDYLTIGDVKRNYHKLTSEDYFSDVVPEITFDKDRGKFDLLIASDREDKMQLELGGNIGTGGVSSAYVGARLEHLNRWLFNQYVGANIGQFYQAFTAKTRMNFPSNIPFYLEPSFNYNSWDFLSTASFLTEKNTAAVRQFDRSLAFRAAIPLGRKLRLSAQIGTLRKSNRFSNNEVFQNTDTLDVNSYFGGFYKLQVDGNSLNAKMFPTEGRKLDFKATFNHGHENYEPGSTSELSASRNFRTWIMLSFAYERYFKVSPTTSLGYSVDTKASSLPAFQTLQSTLLNSPYFRPTFESNTIYQPDHMSPFYAGAGFKVHQQIFQNFALRAEYHGLKPFIKWEEVTPGDVERDFFPPDFFSTVMGGVIYSTPIGPISVTSHYYQANQSFSVLFNIGYLMFNEKPLN